MPKVLLINPSIFHWEDDESSYHPHRVKTHLLELFSYLRFVGIDTAVLDLELEIGRPRDGGGKENFSREAVRLISQFDFDIAAISCWSSLHYLSSLAVADMCREINHNCCIVVGGHHPTALPSDFIYEGSPFDYIVQGEGESALADICKKHDGRRREPQILQGTLLDMTKNIPHDWAGYPYAVPNRGVSMCLSRGCPFKCTFCFNTHKNAWRNLSVSDAIDKVKCVIDTLNPFFLRFEDLFFGYNVQWRRAFLSSLERIAPPTLFFWAFFRADFLEKEDIDLLSRLNFTVGLGLESGSPEMLTIMQKTPNPEKYLNRSRDAIHYLNLKDIPHDIFVLFNHPGETYDTYTTTVGYLQSLLAGHETLSGVIWPQNFFLSPGSPSFLNLDYYERTYGTVVKHKQWWKEEADHYALSTAVIASEDLMKRFSGADYWLDAFNEINTEIRRKLSAKTHKFYNHMNMANLPYPLK